MKNKFDAIQNTKLNLDDTERDWRQLKFSHPKRTVHLGTSFSGIGAIEHALHRLGLNCKIEFAGDVDSDCKKSYFANYDIDESRWHDDIHDFDGTPYKGKVDLLVGGAPCQAFSMRGKRGGFEDTRGTLFREFARLVNETQPKVFIFENVKGILNHDGGNTWQTIKKTFEDYCGYQVYYQVLNGKNYGVPQSRDRLYCIGFKEETEFKYPASIPLTKKVYDYLESSFDGKYFLKEKGVRFITEHINHTKSYTQINGDVMLCQKRNQQFNWHGDFIFHPCLIEENNLNFNDPILHKLYDYEEKYFEDKTPGLFAIKHLDKNNYKMTPVEDDKVNATVGRFRKMTPRECLRLMGFDDTFKIVVPDAAAYKQAGNSIIVDVLMALLKQMDITKYCEEKVEYKIDCEKFTSDAAEDENRYLTDTRDILYGYKTF